MIKLPEMTDEDIHECWQLGQMYALNMSENALHGRTIEEAAEHSCRGLLCERAYFTWLDDGSIEDCLRRQKRGYSSYGSDGKDVDLKSATTDKWGLDFKYRLAVRPDTLQRDKETKYYVLILHDVTGNYLAGWATREEMLAAPIWMKKHAVRMGEGLHEEFPIK